MPLVTVRFDRIFDVVQSMRSRKSVTFFGFEAGGKKQYAVAAPGHIELTEGAEVTAFLRTANNWQTLVGWVVHSTGEIVIEEPHYERFSLVWCVIVSVFAVAVIRSKPILAAAVLAPVLVWAIWCLTSLRGLRRARHQLEDVRLQLRQQARPAKNDA
jgi:hypothetical protein